MSILCVCVSVSKAADPALSDELFLFLLLKLREGAPTLPQVSRTGPIKGLREFAQKSSASHGTHLPGLKTGLFCGTSCAAVLSIGVDVCFTVPFLEKGTQKSGDLKALRSFCAQSPIAN